MKWECETTVRKKYLRCPVCKTCEIINRDEETPTTCRCGVNFDGEAASTWASDLVKYCYGKAGNYYG
jgi:hypothetical protein